MDDLPAVRYPVIKMADLRPGVGPAHGLTACEAVYLALARRLYVGLITLDKGLAAAARADGRLVALPA